MYKLKMTMESTGDEIFTFEEEFESEAEALEWWDKESDEWDTTALWVEQMSGRDIMMEGWDEEEQEDMWSMLN